MVSAFNNLIVLSTCHKLCDFPSSGLYMVHDTAADKLILVPPVNWDEFSETMGRGPVIVPCDG